jgi:hypothetical protein
MTSQRVNHLADAYKVKVEDGYVLFFSGKGLKTEQEGVRPRVYKY